MAFFLGILTIIIAVVSYSLYLRDMFKGKTKPHSVTWLVWGLLNSFIFFEQINNGAGAGAWVTGAAAVANMLIFALSLKYGEKQITRLDLSCLLAAIAILIFWVQTADTMLAIILACAIFIVGFIPTIIKAWRRSQEETTMTFALNGLKFFIALFALQSFTIVTALYPVVLMLLNGGFALFLVVRRIAHR